MPVTKATAAEIDSLKKIIKDVEDFRENAKGIENLKVGQPGEMSLPPIRQLNFYKPPISSSTALFEGGLGGVSITREPLRFDNPVILHTTLNPGKELYRWQYEQLMMMAGYLDGGHSGKKVEITAHNPFLQVMSAANGSGKDEIVIAAFVVWLALTGARNRAIVTSASMDQTKYQTEVHINHLISLANKKLSPGRKLFHSIQFHHIVPELGSEIKLFATDEPGRAEGWHPFDNGKMALILNEAKTIREDMFDAIDRCTGYSHLLYISSPGPKRGRMYKSVNGAITYPAPAELGKFYFRKVTAFECPHIPKSHIDRLIYEKGEDAPWVRSSIFAEFSDFEEPVVISEELWSKCLAAKVEEYDDDIGIGLDLSGGGDETAGFVRCGNRPIHSFFVRQKNSEILVPFIDKQLDPWRNTDYVFRADNGGLGAPIIDKLTSLGWRIRRTNNQSPAYKKTEFLNLGAEMYWHVRRLVSRYDLILPKDPTLAKQITSRCVNGEESNQGKLALQPKSQAIAEGRESPDRADSFVLCFASYFPRRGPAKVETQPKGMTIAELLDAERRGTLFARRQAPQPGRFTMMVKDI